MLTWIAPLVAAVAVRILAESGVHFVIRSTF
jgi:hypothetical protein